MVSVQVCVGSSCHLKGSYDVVQKFQEKMEEEKLDGKLDLAGSFCFGKCNRTGVTVAVNEKVIAGVTVEGFDSFWKEYVVPELRKEGGYSYA